MTLKDEVNELRAMDFFEAAYFSEANRSGPNLRSMGFLDPLRWPPLNRVEPDYFLIHPAHHYCLILDTKSGHLEHDDVEQARAYRALPLYEVSDACERIAKSIGLPNPDIVAFDVGFQYYSHMLEGESLTEYATNSDLDALRKEVTVVTVDSGRRRWGTWTQNNRSLSNPRIDTAFRTGTALPMDPPPNVLLTQRPSDELVALVIADWVLRLRVRQRTVEISPQRVRDELLASYPQVTLAKIESILKKFRQARFCSVPRQDSPRFLTAYAFDSPDRLIPDLINPLYAEKTLDEVTL